MIINDFFSIFIASTKRFFTEPYNRPGCSNAIIAEITQKRDNSYKITSRLPISFFFILSGDQGLNSLITLQSQ